MDFEKSIKKGKVGERVVYDYLDSLDNTKFVIDVRLDKRFQQIEIDYMVYTTKRSIYTLEVKTDDYENDILAYELTTSGNIGCFQKCQADYILYYKSFFSTLYILNTKELKKYVDINTFRIVKMGDKSEGYLISLGDLEKDNVVLKKITDLD